MFKATTSNVKLFRDCIDIISQIIDEGLFKVSKDKIELLAADRSMVAVVDFKISSSIFEEYELDEDMEIGLNLMNFLVMLKRAGTNDKMTLSLDKDRNRFRIKFTGDTTRSFTLPLLDISREEVPDTNKFEFPVSAELDAKIISKGVDDADVIADSVGVELSENGFRMFAEGNASKTELVLDKGTPMLPAVTATQIARSKYPIDYLKKIIKTSKIAEKSTIQMGNDYPLKIGFRSDDNKVSLSFVIAPRVSEE